MNRAAAAVRGSFLMGSASVWSHLFSVFLSSIGVTEGVLQSVHQMSFCSSRYFFRSIFGSFVNSADFL